MDQIKLKGQMIDPLYFPQHEKSDHRSSPISRRRNKTNGVKSVHLKSEEGLAATDADGAAAAEAEEPAVAEAAPSR